MDQKNKLFKTFGVLIILSMIMFLTNTRSEKESEVYTVQDVPHGILSRVWYPIANSEKNP